jgi:hypothetical protein
MSDPADGVSSSPPAPDAGGNRPPTDPPKTTATAAPDPDPKRAAAQRARDAINASSDSHISETNDSLRFLGVMFGDRATVSGTVAGRDVNTTYAFYAGQRDQITTYELTADGIAEMVAPFVKPDGYDNLVAATAVTPVVILRGPAGTGKRALAVNLLAASGAATIAYLDPAADLKLFGTVKTTDRAGYVLCDLPGYIASALTGPVLQGIARHLAGGCRLVITVADGVGFGDPEVERAVLPVAAGSGPEAIFESHLSWRAGPRAVSILAAPGVDRLRSDQLRPGTPLWKAAECARLVAVEFLHGSGDLQAIRDRLAQGHGARLDGWFHGLSDLSTRCFALALATLNGMSAQNVNEQSLALQAALTPGKRSSMPAADPFGSSTSARLGRVGARSQTVTVYSRHGPRPLETVAYEDPSMPRAVLQHVYREYPDVQDALVTWLRDLGGHADRRVRLWAANAAGSLASVAFDHILRVIVRPWAGSSDPKRRDSAAYSLYLPAQDAALATQVRGLVGDWRRSDAPLLKATAARCFGSAIGTLDPKAALAELKELAACDDLDVAYAVGSSLCELFDWNVELVGPTLRALSDWFRNDRPRRYTAMLSFLMIASYVDTTVPAIDPQQPPTLWPTALWVAGADPYVHDRLAGMWHEALNGPLFAEAKRALAIWAEQLNDDPRGVLALTKLLQAVAVDDRTRRIVCAETRAWTKPDSTKQLTVAAHTIRSSICPEA